MSPCCLYSLALTIWFVGQVDGPETPDPPMVSSEGAFSRLLREPRLVEPGVWTVADSERKSVLPADFQRHATLVLVADKLVAKFPGVFVGIVTETHTRIELIGLFSDTEGRDAVRQLLAKHSLPPDCIRLIEVPTDTVWVRDFGPVVVHGADGTRVAFDFEYRRRSGIEARERDDAAADVIARQVGIAVRHAPIELESGNLLSNGQGLLVTTTAAFNANISRGHDARTVARYLHETFGCRTIVLLEPLHGEPTGHVDTFACFTAADTIVVGEYAESIDPLNFVVLERNSAILAKVRVSNGPLRVVRMPMPGNEDSVWRSYTNSVFANGVLLVPIYGGADAQADDLALLTFRRLLPGWRAVGINASKVVRQEGALRCVTLPVVGSGK